MDRPACAAGNWTAPVEAHGASVEALLRNLPATTKWAELPDGTRRQLEQAASDRLAAFRARWAADALAAKEHILIGCPTRDMTDAIDDFYRKTYDTVVPVTFLLSSIRNSELHRALVRNYLGNLAISRASITYPDGKLPNRDWDGALYFDSTSLPDQKTYDDIREYSAKLVDELRSIDDATLEPSEKALKQRVLYDARANAAGGGSNGDADMESACRIVASDFFVLAGYMLDKRRPRIFADDEAVLREVNALYNSNMQVKWLDVGNFNTAVNFCDVSSQHRLVETLVGDPATNDVARSMTLLKHWWIERAGESSDAHRRCTIYSPDDRTRIWQAFSAASLFNNDDSFSMEDYRSLLAAYVEKNRKRYRDIAKTAVALVFPDDAILTPGQRKSVNAAIEGETAFGLFPEKIGLAIDAAQGLTNGPGAVHWKNAIAQHVERIGGNYRPGDNVRPGENKELEDMFAEVEAWVAREHRRYAIDIESLYPHIAFHIDAQVGVPDTVPPGTITIGVGTARSKLEYYSWMIHELRHAVWMAQVATAVDKSKSRNDEGLAVEGSGAAVETLLLEPFARAVLKNDMAYALYALDYGIRDARFAGTTDATLQKYFRASCWAPGDPDSIDFTKNIAASYGLTGPLADTVALRAHLGTQYLQYIMGGLHVVDEISYLQSRIDPSFAHRIDPYVLFACGLNNPSRDAAYVAALKSCMKL